MDTNYLFEKINMLLENINYPVEITDITELEEFLNNEENAIYEEYDEIAQIYDQIMEGSLDLEDDLY